MSDIVKIYNPANAASLTPEQTADLQKLTSAEIKQLANAYPNMSMQRAYLLIIDNTKPVEKQLPSLSTFENLYNLREKNGLRQFVAFGFKGSYQPKNINPVKSKAREVLDLSETELMSLPGFKTAASKLKETTEIPAKTVAVKKIKKQKIK